MKTVVKYQAEDGCLFDDVVDAQRRDALMSRLHFIEQTLGSRVDDWNHRKQHDLAKFQEFKRDLVALCRELYPTEAVFRAEPLTLSPFSYAGRFLDDAGPGVLNRVWQRLMCITDEGMEYSQPFFALNPDRWQP